TRSVCALLLLLALAGPGRGQEPPPDGPQPPVPPGPPIPEEPIPAPGPTVDKAEQRLATEGKKINVEKPTQLLRIKAKLERLRQTRAALTTHEMDLDARARELTSQEQSPILTPRLEVITLTLDQAIGMTLELNPDY